MHSKVVLSALAIASAYSCLITVQLAFYHTPRSHNGNHVKIYATCVSEFL